MIKTGMTKEKVIKYLELEKIAAYYKKELPLKYCDKNDKQIIDEFITGENNQLLFN